MKQFILFYKGPVTPHDASHKGWPEWFGKLGDKLVNRGAPMADGFVMHHDGTESNHATHINGYTIIQAEDRENVKELIKDHPYLSLGKDYVIEIFQLPER